MLRPGAIRDRRRQLGRLDALLHAGVSCSPGSSRQRGVEPVAGGSAGAGHLLRRPPRARLSPRRLGSCPDGDGRLAAWRCSSTRPRAAARRRSSCRGSRRRWTQRRVALPGRDSRRTSSTDARRSSRAAEAGEVPVVMSGDGLIGQVGGVARRLRGRRSGSIPGGRGNDFARVARDPRPTSEAAVAVLAGGRRPPRSTSARSNGQRFLCIASCGFDSDANRIANEAKLHQAATSSTPTPRCARWSRWKPARLHDHARRRAQRVRAATRSPSPTARPTAAACSSPPTPSSTTACSTWSSSARSASCASWLTCRRCSRARHVEQRRGQGLRAPPRSRIERRPAVRRLRRRRAHRRPAGDRPRLLPRALRVIVPPQAAGLSARPALSAPRSALARAIGALSRRSGRGGGHDAARAGCCCAWRRTRSRRLGAGLERRLDDRQRHQRQDDDRRDDRRGAARRRPRAGPQPRRVEHDLGRRHRAARAARRARACSRSTRPGCRGSRRELDPKLIVLGNLFRDQLDRYGELEHARRRVGGDGRAPRRAHRLRAQRRRSADRRPRAATRELAPPRRGHLLRDRGRLPGAARAPARLRRQALPPLRRTPTPTSAPSSATSATTRARTAAPTGPSPTSPRPRSSCAGCAARASRSRTPGGRGRARAAAPGLYNVYNALAAIAAGAAARGSRSSDGRARWLDGARPCSGGSRRSTVGGTPVSILLIKNPAGANEVLRTLRLEARRRAAGLDLWIALNDRIADGRDVSWVWDADFELLAGAVRRVVCAGTRAPEMAVRLKYAGVDRRRDRGRGGDRAARSTGPSPARHGRLFALPTYTALIELRTLLVASAAWRGSSGGERRATPMLWHDVECGAYAADLALWERARPTRPAARCSSWAAAPAGSRCTWPPWASRSSGSTPIRRSLGRRSTGGPRAAGLWMRRRVQRRRPRASTSDARFGLVLAPMQLLQLLAGEAERRRCLARGRQPSQPRRPTSRRRILAPRARVEGGDDGAAAPRRARASTAGSTRASPLDSRHRRRADRRPPPAPDGLARTAR